MMKCPCNPNKIYSQCCQPYITAEKVPESPEALMRSRYTAYTLANIDYIKQTMRGKALVGFQEIEAIRWAKRVTWIKLTVLDSSTDNRDKGFVEFEAIFVDGSRLNSIHEKSEFIREEGRWYYVDGSPLASSHPQKMVSRNTSCPCGSLRKFKNCHQIN